MTLFEVQIFSGHLKWWCHSFSYCVHCFFFLFSFHLPPLHSNPLIIQMEAINWSNELIWFHIVYVYRIQHLNNIFKNQIVYNINVFCGSVERHNKCIYFKFKLMSIGMHFSIDFLCLYIMLHNHNIWCTFNFYKSAFKF